METSRGWHGEKQTDGAIDALRCYEGASMVDQNHIGNRRGSRHHEMLCVWRYGGSELYLRVPIREVRLVSGYL